MFFLQVVRDQSARLAAAACYTALSQFPVCFLHTWSCRRDWQKAVNKSVFDWVSASWQRRRRRRKVGEVEEVGEMKKKDWWKVDEGKWSGELERGGGWRGRCLGKKKQDDNGVEEDVMEEEEEQIVSQRNEEEGKKCETGGRGGGGEARPAGYNINQTTDTCEVVDLCTSLLWLSADCHIRRRSHHSQHGRQTDDLSLSDITGYFKGRLQTFTEVFVFFSVVRSIEISLKSRSY